MSNETGWGWMTRAAVEQGAELLRIPVSSCLVSPMTPEMEGFFTGACSKDAAFVRSIEPPLQPGSCSVFGPAVLHKQILH